MVSPLPLRDMPAQCGELRWVATCPADGDGPCGDASGYYVFEPTTEPVATCAQWVITPSAEFPRHSWSLLSADQVIDIAWTLFLAVFGVFALYKLLSPPTEVLLHDQ